LHSSTDAARRRTLICTAAAVFCAAVLSACIRPQPQSSLSEERDSAGIEERGSASIAHVEDHGISLKLNVALEQHPRILSASVPIHVVVKNLSGAPLRIDRSAFVLYSAGGSEFTSVDPREVAHNIVLESRKKGQLKPSPRDYQEWEQKVLVNALRPTLLDNGAATEGIVFFPPTYQRRLIVVASLGNRSAGVPGAGLRAVLRQAADVRLRAHSPTDLNLGEVAPEVELDDLSGRRHKLGEIVGQNQLLLVSVWATWCGACRMELPILAGLYREKRPEGLEVIVVSVDEDRQDMGDFLAHTNFPFRFLHDADGMLQERWGVRALPTMVLFDRDRRVLQTYTGVSRHLKREIDEFLQKKRQKAKRVREPPEVERTAMQLGL
jgi:thiol-disulfide isomerase/thioredoxin